MLVGIEYSYLINSEVKSGSYRFSMDLDIAAPKITIPTKFCPDGIHETKLLLDLGNLILRTQVIYLPF